MSTLGIVSLCVGGAVVLTLLVLWGIGIGVGATLDVFLPKSISDAATMRRRALKQAKRAQRQQEEARQHAQRALKPRFRQDWE